MPTWLLGTKPKMTHKQMKPSDISRKYWSSIQHTAMPEGIWLKFIRNKLRIYYPPAKMKMARRKLPNCIEWLAG